MDTSRRERLEQAGFRVGTVAEFLSLTPEESELVESKVALNASSITRDELADVIADQPGHQKAKEGRGTLPLRV